MAEIFKFPEGGRRSEQPKAQTAKSPESTDEDRGDLLRMLVERMQESGHESVMLSCIAIESALNSLRGAYNAASIAQRRQGLKAFTDDEIRDMVLSSTEINWTEKPSYYYALIDEAKERKLK